MLVVDGGSTTYGHGLDNLKDAWPYIVDPNAISLAKPGKSIKHIEISLQSYYYNTAKFDCCIIAWPNTVRTCVYKADTREYVGYGPRGLYGVYNDDKFVNTYYKKYFCQVESLRTHWLRCLRLICWFKQNNIRWMMLNQDRIEQEIYTQDPMLFPWFNNTNDNDIKEMFSNLKTLEKEIINQKNYKGFTDYYIGSRENGGVHPNKEQHIKIGKHIKEWWNTTS